MLVRSDLKSNAKVQIKGSIGILFVCYILMGLITGTMLGSILTPVLYLSLCMIFLNLTKGVKPEIGDLFKGMNLFGTALILQIITGFFVFLWSILLIVPGIIKAISYSMAPFILAENQDMTAFEALNESKRITEGHKMDLFVLGLSFIPWLLLVGVTFGLAAIYVTPYMFATFTNAYNVIKTQPEAVSQ
ncbi:MAG: DUF975 family protein [Oscillospiraceae bacterium]|nr:DUF975 family protein [Oscillospiraceae bacterium]